MAAPMTPTASTTRHDHLAHSLRFAKKLFKQLTRTRSKGLTDHDIPRLISLEDALNDQAPGWTAKYKRKLYEKRQAQLVAKGEDTPSPTTPSPAQSSNGWTCEATEWESQAWAATPRTGVAKTSKDNVH